MENQQEILEQQVTENISQTYGLFSTIFLGEWEKLLSLLSNNNEIDEDHFLSFINELKGTDPLELKIQYDNLFVAPGYYFVSPFQESYSNDDDQIRGILGSLYEQAGIHEKCEEKGELPDHLGCILAYMQWLVHLESFAENKEEMAQLRALQAGFIENHLQWVNKLKSAVVRKLEYGFILEALQQLQLFIEYHREELSGSINQ